MTFNERMKLGVKTIKRWLKPAFRIQMDPEYKHLVPRKEHPTDAGYDLRAAISENVIVHPGEAKLVYLGFKCALPEGYELQIRPRSGLALNHYISVLNTPGTVDCNYRGPVSVILFNFGKYDYVVEPFDRIAQGVVCKLPSISIEQVSELEDTDRGSGGFGSTGKE